MSSSTTTSATSTQIKISSNDHFTVKNEIIEEKEVIEIDDNDDEMADKPNTNENSETRLEHCNLCDMVMMNQAEMQKHISERRNILYSCDICSFKACTLDGLIGMPY